MITEKEIYEIKITPKVLEKARDRAGNFKANSLTFSKQIDSKIAGFVAEEIFVDNFGGNLVADSSYFHDVELPMGNIDIKVKRCKSKPLISYDCSVSAYQVAKQKCDNILFCRVDYEFKTLWICGIISSKDFVKKSKLVKKGERDGGFVCGADMYNIAIKDLNNFMEFVL